MRNTGSSTFNAMVTGANSVFTVVGEVAEVTGRGLVELPKGRYVPAFRECHVAGVTA